MLMKMLSKQTKHTILIQDIISVKFSSLTHHGDLGYLSHWFSIKEEGLILIAFSLL